MRNIAILGSSGSIGRNALWVAERFPEELNVFGLAVNANTSVLTEQILQYHPQVVCVADAAAAARFSSEAGRLGVELLCGDAGLETLASHPDVRIVLNAVVGFAGLRSTLAAAAAGKRIALANKESMVAGGKLVNNMVTAGKGELIPVDSEHSAIFQCLKSGRMADVRRLILTSSGGPFRQHPLEKFGEITVEQALKHPTWNMGKKITIDSATLMNKGLEIIEAVHLFGVPCDRIKVVIHPQSIVHSIVEFADGAMIAQLSKPDMRLPIEYALFYPERRTMEVADLWFAGGLTLEFEDPDERKFPSLRLARSAVQKGGTAPAVLNAANEIAVQTFLDRKATFLQIFEMVDYALQNARLSAAESIDSIIEADKNGRELALKYLAARNA